MGASPDLQRLEVPVSGGRLLGIEGTNPGSRLEQPLYAVNLLSCRRPWAYNLYSALGYPGVRSVGGRLIFKGRRRRVLYGDADEVRDTLLIVRYPDGDSFLDMVRRPFFGAISLLRRLGISGFQFGFTTGHTPDGAAAEGAVVATPRPAPYRGDRVFLLWGVGGTPQHAADLFAPLRRLCESRSDLDLVFSGQLTARMTVRHKKSRTSESTRLAPPLPWTGIALLSAADDAVLERFMPAATESLGLQSVDPSVLVFYDRQY